MLFLIAGDAKREAVKRWRAGENIPAQAIRPPSGVDVLIESKLLSETERDRLPEPTLQCFVMCSRSAR